MDRDEDQELLEALQQLSPEDLRLYRTKLLRNKRRVKRRLLPYLLVEWVVLAGYYIFVLCLAAAPFIAAYHIFDGNEVATVITGMAGLLFVTRASELLEPKFEWLYSGSSYEYCIAEWDRLGAIQTKIEEHLLWRDPSFGEEYWASSSKRSLEDLRWGARRQ